MKGSIHFRKDSGWWFVKWYDAKRKKSFFISRYRGERMYHKKIAGKLLATMQADQEAGVFRIEKFTGEQFTDVIPYLTEWLNAVRPTLTPATVKDYKNSIRNHLEPFFRKNNFQLHEIQFDVLVMLLNSINRTGKGKLNVMYCLHACLKYAWKSRRIPEVPAFPEKRLYQIQEPSITWLPEERQMAIIDAIPEEHQPIFLWLKYHLRRPAEACVLKWEDWDRENGVFIIRRSESARQIVERTKTGVEHIIPAHSEFVRYFSGIERTVVSQFMFVNSRSRSAGKRYTNDALNLIWHKACREVGESIDLYSGLKHSSCSQYINEKGLSVSDLQQITDHARLESVRKYAKMEVARKRELMERGKVVKLERVENDR
ncbi:MAG: tyrosine-type recombinase/integrase [Desulfobacterales bacterium]|nr:tyrosine-type recombinase/integrase [Desulfobacterales bacterium]